MEPPPRPTASLFEVYLRLRPSFAPNAERFLDVETGEDKPTHITIRPPASDHRRRAVEKFAFTRVFEEDAAQLELFKDTGLPSVIQGVLGHSGSEGRDGLLATLGVTGSGKSHTILGSKAQRGLTQLSLDVLFQSLGDLIADLSRNESTTQSICASDVSEGQVLTASTFLDAMYGDGAMPERNERGNSRATTPMLVGTLSQQSQSVSNATHQQDPSRGLYPNLPHYARPQSKPSVTVSAEEASMSNPFFSFSPFKKSETKTVVSEKDCSFMSMPSSNSRKYLPRLSCLPQYPLVDDVEVGADQGCEYAVVVSMYEVYNDRIFDLLINSTSKAAIQKRRGLLFKNTELSPDRKVVAGLRKVICSNMDEALLVLETGLTERKVAGTGSNEASSRSHGFFCLEVKKRTRGTFLGPWTTSNLTIVDLAGSERARTAKTAGATLAEAGKINESLMYLGQCMQMQSDNGNSAKPQSMVPFRQCKLTELLFSNSYPSAQQQSYRRSPQKAIMVVTADPLGDYNATSQILRYSALAREVTVPRIPSVSSTIMAGSTRPGALASGRCTPTAAQEELELALAEIAALREQMALTQIHLDEEISRRREAESAWTAAEERIEQVEQEVREEVWQEMEARMDEEQRRWRAAREEEAEHNDERLDKKLDILSRTFVIHEDPEPTIDERMSELEDENEMLKARLANMEREKGLRSPSKKMRVLKTRKWEGSDVGLGGSP